MPKYVIYIFNLKILALICLISLPFFSQAYSQDEYIKKSEINKEHISKDNEEKAKEYIKGLISAVEQINSQNDTAEQKLRLQELIGQNIDIESAARFVLGRYYKQFSPNDFDSFKQDFKIYLKKKYALILSGNSGKAKIIRVQSREDDIIIKTKVEFEDQNPLEIAYILIPKGDKFYIFDIILEQGIRLSLADRDDFTKSIQQTNIPHFLKTIKALNK